MSDPICQKLAMKIQIGWVVVCAANVVMTIQSNTDC